MALARVTGQRQHGGIVRTQPFHPRAIEEAGMFRQQAIQGRQLGHQVGFGAPGQTAGLMDVELLLRQPLHPSAEAVGSALARQAAQAVAQEGPRGAPQGQALVVVGLAVVDQGTEARRLAEAVVQVARHGPGVVVLEQLRVGPLHPALAQQAFGGRPGPAQALKEEHAIRERLAHPGPEVPPDLQGHHVARVTSESIHPAPAPGEQGFGDGLPEGRRPAVQLRQIAPGHAPGAGTEEASFGIAAEPLRVGLHQPGAPARVVHDDVQEEAPAPQVDAIGQFLELLHGRGAPVELDQGRVDGGEVELGVGAAEAPHAGEGGGHGAHGQQVEDAAAQRVENVGQAGRQVAQGAGGRDHRQSLPVLLRPGGLQDRIPALPQGAVRAEHAGEGAVEQVGGAEPVRQDAHLQIVALRPVLEAERIHGVGLGPEGARFREGQVQRPAALLRSQGNVPPGDPGEGAGGFGQGARQGHHLVPGPGPPGEVGAQQGRPARLSRGRMDQVHAQPVPHVANGVVSGDRCHGGSEHGSPGGTDPMVLPGRRRGGADDDCGFPHLATVGRMVAPCPTHRPPPSSRCSPNATR